MVARGPEDREDDEDGTAEDSGHLDVRRLHDLRRSNWRVHRGQAHLGVSPLVAEVANLECRGRNAKTLELVFELVFGLGVARGDVLRLTKAEVVTLKAALSASAGR